MRNVFDLLAGTVTPFSDRVILSADHGPFFGSCSPEKLDRDFVRPWQYRRVQRLGGHH
jgi:hypothetical protein